MACHAGQYMQHWGTAFLGHIHAATLDRDASKGFDVASTTSLLQRTLCARLGRRHRHAAFQGHMPCSI